jgi:excisionase family DNA binding protein
MTTNQHPPLAGELLTIKETINALRCGRTKYYELVAAGDLEIIRLGPKSIRVKLASVEKLLAQGVE